MIKNIQCSFFIFVGFFLLTPAALYANITGPGWFAIQAEPVTPEEARSYYDARNKTQPVGLPPYIMPLAAVRIDDRITELARALQHDPILIFEYVHNYIDYVPYYGALKGSTLTLLDRSGNDFFRNAVRSTRKLAKC